MKTDPIYTLAQIVLPSEVLKYFNIVNIESNPSEFYIHLDEKMSDNFKNDVHFESKGFMEPVRVTDFPIRDHKVILVIRRRRWMDIRTGKSFSIPLDIDVAAKGSRYSNEFAAFLKGTYGDIPSDLPYA